jgi:ribonuclease BN (tRNA processing enzyme)
VIEPSPAAQGLRVTVLGSSSAIPRPGRACSGYLVEAGGAAIVSDLGSGALSNLHRVRAAEDVDAVVISHMHADHFIDVIPMRYALKYGPRTHARKVALWLPPGGAAMLRKLVDAFARESPHDFIGEVFEVGEYDPLGTLRFGDAAVRFAPTAHYIPTFAFRCDAGAASVAYTADTAPSDDVAALARRAGLFLCEATLLPGEREDAPRGHLSAFEAGELAERAEVGRLALTHYPVGVSVEELRAAAGRAFSGALSVVDDVDVLQV